MKKNGLLKKILALSLCFCTALTAFGCGGGNNSGEAIDSSRTTLNVFFHYAGYGDAWTRELKSNFEEAMKDVSFEEGKKGVQVIFQGEQRDWSASQIKNSRFDVFFVENPADFLNVMAEGAVEPLDSIVTPKNPDDGNRSIEDKMSEQQKAFYNYNGHYYGIPHYSGTYGIVYNKDMFDARGFYLAKNPDDETGNILITTKNPEKSVGPDGIAGTYDDGLPRTYDEFFDLCVEINNRAIDPVCFPGEYASIHLSFLLHNLVSNAEGADQINLDYSFNGVAENLVKIENGNIVFDSNGKPVTESLTITESNGYELARQLGRYYGFSFMRRLLTNKDFYSQVDDTRGVSQTECEQHFVENELIGERPSAMLIDGTWWQNEIPDVFDYWEKQNANYSKDNRNFGWMPFPQPTEEEAEKVASGEKKSVFSDWLNSVAYVKAGLSAGTKNAALSLLKYFYTDKGLTDFTYTTGNLIGLDYLDKVDRNKLNSFEKSVFDYCLRSDVIHQIPSCDLYARNVSKLSISGYYGYSRAKNVYDGFKDFKPTAEEYFVSHRSYFKGLAW